MNRVTGLLCLCTLSMGFLVDAASEAHAQWSESATENDSVIVFSGDQIKPGIVPDGSGGAIVVWQDNRNGDSDIYAGRIKASGARTWNPDGVPVVNLPESDQRSPTVVTGDTDALFVAWQDDRNVETIFNIFAQKIDRLFGQVQWTPANGVQVQGGINFLPRIIRDSAFGAIVASYSISEENFLIYLQKVNSDGDAQWDPFTKPSNDMAAPQPLRPPAIVTDDNRGAIVTWADRRDGTLRVYAMRVDQNGQRAWPADVQVSEALTSNTEPVIVSDGAGGAIVAWVAPQTPGSSDAIKAQRLDINGTAQWGSFGRELVTTAAPKRNIRMLKAAPETVAIVWEDLSSGQDWDIAMVRINALGQKLEPEFELVNSLQDQINPNVISDRRGGVIVVWEDKRATDTDIYAQLITPAGDPRWGDNGMAVSTVPGNQTNPTLIDDALGGTIIVWEDRRNPDSIDIYAQRVSAPGVLGEFRAVTVDKPNAPLNWEVGSTQTIRWTFRGEIDSVVAELSRDGGQTYPEVLSPPRASSDSLIWVVSGPPADRSKVRVSARNASFIYDESDVDFAISAPQGPTLQPAVVTGSAFGDSIEITTRAQDVTGIRNVFLHVRKGGAAAFDSLKMASVGADSFAGFIPADFVTERGVEYFVSSTDHLGNASRSEAVFVTVRFGFGTQRTQLRRGTSQTAYRMLSAPNLLEVTAVDSIFSRSGFGAYDTTMWRMFEYRDGDYVERDSLNAASFQFTPGKAFWVISARDRTVDFGAGVSLRADTAFAVNLQPGWNQIGVPFAFPVAWLDILNASGNPTSVDGPFLYEGGYHVSPNLEPYKGYFVNNLDTLNAVTLVIPPVATESQDDAAKHSAVAAGAQWKLQIVARSQEAIDHFNYLGVHEEASPTRDALDHTEPPPVGAYVSVYFPRTQWPDYPGRYTTDFRPALNEGQTWPLVVETNIARSEVNVEFTGLETLPADVQVYLMDEALNIIRNVRREPSYTFASGEHGGAKALTLIVGSTAFVEQETGRVASVPERFELHQNFPNPFNPVTSIRFGLPEKQRVTLKIYDLLGREVATLAEDVLKEPGYHVLTWDGRDANDQPVASGLYIYRLQAGTFTEARKMLLVK